MSKETLAKKIAEITGKGWCFLAAIEAGITDSVPLAVYQDEQREVEFIEDRVIETANIDPKGITPLLEKIHHGEPQLGKEFATLVVIKGDYSPGCSHAFNVEPAPEEFQRDYWEYSGDLFDGTTKVTFIGSKINLPKQLDITSGIPNVFLIRR